jgi:hypothetical protein
MNKRIKELEPQCWEHNEFGLNFNYEKFAELIVRECANVAADHDALDIYEEIREHFGVEE